jgi:uncharacterized protein (TIGR00251 family)
MLEWMNETSEGLTLAVRAVPRAAKNEIQGVYDEALKIRLITPPVDGKANQALIRFLSKALHLSKSQIRILRGETSRNKILRITGISKEELTRIIERAME